MELVVDTNVVFSALIADGVTRELTLMESLSLPVPEFFLTEFTAHLDAIEEKSGLDESKLRLLAAVLFDPVRMVPKEVFADHIPEAMDLIGAVDPDDVPFLALAIHLDSGIWSDDEHFQQQDAITVWRTSELAHHFHTD